MQQVPSPATTQRAFTIPNLRLISLFACNTPKKVATLAYVNEIFRETMIDYETAVLIWDKQADSYKYNLRQVRGFLFNCCCRSPSINWVVHEMLHCPLLNEFFQLFPATDQCVDHSSWKCLLIDAIIRNNIEVIKMIFDFTIDQVNLHNSQFEEERTPTTRNDEDEDNDDEKDKADDEELIAFEEMMAENLVGYDIKCKLRCEKMRTEVERALKLGNLETFTIVVEKLELLGTLKSFLSGFAAPFKRSANGLPRSHKDEQNDLPEQILRDCAYLQTTSQPGLSSSSLAKIEAEDLVAKFCLLAQKVETLLSPWHIKQIFGAKYAYLILRSGSAKIIEVLLAAAAKYSFLQSLTQVHINSSLGLPNKRSNGNIVLLCLAGKPKEVYARIIKLVLLKFETLLGIEIVERLLRSCGDSLLLQALTESCPLETVKSLVETMKRCCPEFLKTCLTSASSVQLVGHSTVSAGLFEYLTSVMKDHGGDAFKVYFCGNCSNNINQGLSPLNSLVNFNHSMIKYLLEKAEELGFIKEALLGAAAAVSTSTPSADTFPLDKSVFRSLFSNPTVTKESLQLLFEQYVKLGFDLKQILRALLDCEQYSKDSENFFSIAAFSLPPETLSALIEKLKENDLFCSDETQPPVSSAMNYILKKTVRFMSHERLLTIPVLVAHLDSQKSLTSIAEGQPNPAMEEFSLIGTIRSPFTDVRNNHWLFRLLHSHDCWEKCRRFYEEFKDIGNRNNRDKFIEMLTVDKK